MIELKNPEHWQKAVESIAGFISEGNFRFSTNGISFQAMDPSQVVLVDYRLDKKHFAQYDVEPNLVGLDISEFSKILSRGFDQDTLTMDLTDASLNLVFEGDLSRSFQLPLIDVSDEELRFPNPNYDVSVEINARILKETLKDASLFGSSVVFSVKDKHFLIEAKGNPGILKSSVRDPKHVSVNAKKDVTCKFSLGFLQSIVKAAAPDSKIVLEIKEDSAMKVSYSIGPTKISFYLAHMIL